jgi:protein SCO1/2
MARFFGLLLVGFCSFLLQACNQPAPSFKNTDLTGASYARDFSLTDANGKPRTLADFKGKVVVVFFGYTQCPDVCPTTLSEMAGVMKKLGPLADQVQMLFITLDPEHDTPAILAQYVPSFDPRFLALTGDTAAIQKAAQEFKVVYQKVAGTTGGTTGGTTLANYSIDHTAASFVFDPQGRIRLYVRSSMGPEALEHDLRSLLN